jgi:hypothetical protein
MGKWPDLREEFDRWQEAGQIATFWWRDDDAAAPTARLRRVLSIASEVPVSLAVIPAAAERELTEWLAHCPRSVPGAWIAVLQHGWRHLNHFGFGKKSEFPVGRADREVACDLVAGWARLSELFGIRALPVFVPPWNRLDNTFLPLLESCGFHGISRSRPRATARPAPGIVEANIHVDLVDWAGGRGFIGEEPALGGLIGHLRARRLGAVDADEPTGILTHHLIQDEATNAFLDRLLAMSVPHPAVRWLDPREVFALAA